MAWPTVTIVTTAMDAGTDSPATARAEIKQMADNVNAIKDSRSAASGIASLDATAKVPTGELPVIPATLGGTGASSYTVGDVLYANTTTTLAKLAAGTAGYALTSNGPGTAPSFQQVGGFAPGTRMPFNQTAAPTGWTKVTAGINNDSIMRIVTGTVASGGSLAFSTWAAQTSDGATTLSESQIPSHIHVQQHYSSGSGSSSFGPDLSSTSTSHKTTTPINNATQASTQGTGGGSSHTHSLSQNLLYHDFIIAQKD